MDQNEIDDLLKSSDSDQSQPKTKKQTKKGN